jgi:rRNA processing protein Gar1
MPNIHNIAFPLEKYGITNKDHTGNPDIFYPIDEPHGMIKVRDDSILLQPRCYSNNILIQAEVRRAPRFKSRL